MDNIRGKTIAITGAARGIGLPPPGPCWPRGARVVIGDRDVALEEFAVAKLGNLGTVSGYPLDVTDQDLFATFLDKAESSRLFEGLLAHIAQGALKILRHLAQAYRGRAPSG